MNGLSILIVNYNGALFLQNAVRSFQEVLERNRINHEFLIYDNASTDASIQVIEDLKKSSPVIESYYSGVNQGFARANNILSRHAKYSMLVFLNNDTVTVDIKELCEYSKNCKLKDDTVYTCNILNGDGTTQRNVFLFPKVYKLVAEILLLKPMLLKLFPTRIDKQDNLDQVYFSGCYFVMNKLLFEEAGCFDEKFFFYHEECDLFIRLKAFDVKKVILNDKVIHFGSGGTVISDFSFKNYYVNLCRLFIKHKYVKPWLIKFVFRFGFNLRMLLLSLKIKIHYSPFAQNYKSNYKGHSTYKHLIQLHRNTLREILSL